MSPAPLALPPPRRPCAEADDHQPQAEQDRRGRLRHGRDLAEDAIRIDITPLRADPRDEVERVRVEGGSTRAKGDPPESGKGDRRTVRVQECAEEGTRVGVERIDLAVV